MDTFTPYLGHFILVNFLTFFLSILSTSVLLVKKCLGHPAIFKLFFKLMVLICFVNSMMLWFIRSEHYIESLGTALNSSIILFILSVGSASIQFLYSKRPQNKPSCQQSLVASCLLAIPITVLIFGSYFTQTQQFVEIRHFIISLLSYTVIFLFTYKVFNN